MAILLGGCAAPVRQWQPATNPDTLPATTFLHYLATAPVVTVDEGMRAVLLLTDDGARFPTFERRYAVLLRRGAVIEDWNLQKDQVLTKGTLAYMLRALCALPPGVTETVLVSTTGWGDRRYALKTAIHAGLLPYGRAGDPVRGGELLSAVSRAETCLVDAPGDSS